VRDFEGDGVVAEDTTSTKGWKDWMREGQNDCEFED